MARRIYQIKVSLTGTSPPIWRRILVSANVTLRQASGVLQQAMGWPRTDRYRYRMDGREFGAFRSESEYLEDDTMFSLRSCLHEPKDAFEYICEGWVLSIVLEGVSHASGRLPWRVVGGEGESPKFRAPTAAVVSVAGPRARRPTLH